MKNYLAFDLRALALMRIAVAIVVLLDLGVRLNDLEAFYSNTGVIPLPLLFAEGWNDYFLSLHVISGLWQVQAVLFILAIIFASLMLLGYRSRLFTILSWFMMLSLHNRNGFILQGGDDLLRMILFWGIFLPWGRRYSCDRLLSGDTGPDKIRSVACIAYLLQVCYIYTGSALLKGGEWNQDFTAMYYVYQLEQVAYPVTKLFLYHPAILKIFTMIAYYFELLVPVLFFLPFFHAISRTLGVILIIIFHGFNLVTLFIGMFPLIGISTCLALLPGEAMDLLEYRFSKLKNVIAESFKSIGLMLQSLISWKNPAPTHPVIKKVATACLVFLTLFVFDWNFSNLTFVNSKLSDNLRVIGYGLRLDQNWGMFAPGVFKDDGWFVLEGTTEKDSIVDIWRDGRGVSYGKPASITGLYPNDRWRKYSESLILTWRSFLRGYFCNYSRRIWNEKEPNRRIKSLKVVFMSEFTKYGYKIPPASREVLCDCN